VETKLASLACHRTQISNDGPFEQLPQDVVHRLMGTEYYQLAAPAGAVDALANIT
jgi:LmbE family N-acetylglucosaminyl deacetylase